MIYSPDEFFVEDEQLENYGENLARSLKPSGSVSARRCAAAAATQRKALSAIHAALLRRGGAARESSAAEWLLDNWYLAKREGGEAIVRLREAGRLRAVPEKNGQGARALVQCLAEAFVHAGAGSVTALRAEGPESDGKGAFAVYPGGALRACCTDCRVCPAEGGRKVPSAHPKRDGARLFLAAPAEHARPLGGLSAR